MGVLVLVEGGHALSCMLGNQEGCGVPRFPRLAHCKIPGGVHADATGAVGYDLGGSFLYLQAASAVFSPGVVVHDEVRSQPFDRVVIEA